MTKVSELVSQNVGNTITNYNTWNGILFNVKVYGAKGNNVADDTVAVQAAINAAVAANGTLVFFPPGTYKVTSLTNTTTINFVGDNATFSGYVGTITEFGVSNLTSKFVATPIYNVKGYGATGNGTTDDTSSIQATINAARDAGGGVVYFPTGKYKITSTLNINHSSIVLVGNGSGNSHNLGLDDNATVLTWGGTAGGTMISVSAVSGASNQNISRSGVEGIHLDGSVSAGIGIEVKSHNMGTFENLYLNEFTSKAISLDVVPTLGEAIDTQSNTFENIFIRQTVSNGDGIYLNGLANGNTSYNQFKNIDILHSNGKGIVLATCDNNLFEKIRLTRTGTGTGLGIEFLGSSTSALFSAAANHMVHVTSPSGVTARGGTYPSTSNNIFFYDIGNGSPFPTIESGATLNVYTEEGIFYNPGISHLAIGDGITPTRAAKSAIGNTSLYIRNQSANHIVLDDGTNKWTVVVDATGNLQIFRLTSGSGQIKLFNGLMLDNLQVS